MGGMQLFQQSDVQGTLFAIKSMRYEFNLKRMMPRVELIMLLTLPLVQILCIRVSFLEVLLIGVCYKEKGN